jgi:tRNA-Thr(GGU) m(6)t(6)A37 methyltransferase TsaA
MTEFNSFAFTPIGIVHSPFQEKFGIPRQPGLAKVDAVIELSPPFSQPDTVGGLDRFSHIWVVFAFHGVISASGSDRQWHPLVRPPRLGGNEKKGVFATRSTHRPNPIGLSAVELLRVEIENGVKLHIRGGDLLNGTPVLDIKPYIPYADAIPDARASFAQFGPQRLNVRWREGVLAQAQKLSDELPYIVEEALSFDPRPAYQNEPERIYGVHIGGCNVRFRIAGDDVEIIEITALI